MTTIFIHYIAVRRSDGNASDNQGTEKYNKSSTSQSQNFLEVWFVERRLRELEFDPGLFLGNEWGRAQLAILPAPVVLVVSS